MNMKNNKGFTLIELIAVIVLVGLIALVITPKITKVLKTQKMNIFKESVEGIVKSVKEDAVNNAGFNSTTTSNYRAYIYDGTGLYLTVAGNKASDEDIKISGKIDKGQGTVVVTKDSEIVLAIYNDKFCAKKNADDTSITVEEYSGTCVNDEIDIPEATSCFVYETNPDNTLTITGYDYNNASCSKDLVIPNRINGKIVSKLADLAFVDAEAKIVLYSEKDEYGDAHFYEEYAANVPSDKEILYLITANNADITTKTCYTDAEENNSISVDVNYVHTPGDGYYGCSFEKPHTPEFGTINNYKFNSIDFSRATALTKIPFGLIPFSSVGSINIGDYITEIGTMAFTKNYIKSIKIPKNIIDIDYFAFQLNQTDNVDFTNAQNLKSIKSGAFFGNSINSVNIHDLNNLESIDGNYLGAFEENQLTSVTLKNLPKLINIGELDDESGAFSDNNISTLVFDNVPNLKVLGVRAFYMNSLSTVTLPNTITTLGYRAFAHNNLTSILMPDSLTTIGDYAFGYNNISTVTFSNNITSLGMGVLSHNALTTVTIPNTITTIEQDSFSSNALTSVIIPTSVTSIGDNAFYQNQLSSVAIPTSVTSIGNSAFQYNNILQGSATIDNSAANVTLGTNAFDNNGADRLTIITPVFSQ